MIAALFSAIICAVYLLIYAVRSLFKHPPHIRKFYSNNRIVNGLVHEGILTKVSDNSDGTSNYEMPHWIWVYLMEHPELLSLEIDKKDRQRYHDLRA